jgi:hypothetical protein
MKDFSASVIFRLRPASVGGGVVSGTMLRIVKLFALELIVQLTFLNAVTVDISRRF